MSPQNSSVFGNSLIFGRLMKILRRLVPGLRENPLQIKIPRWGTWLLSLAVFSCVFIPRFHAGTIAFSYQVDVRIEDLLLAALGIFALILAAGGKTPSAPAAAESAFLAFLAAALLSILTGIYLGTVDKPFLSLLYCLKWLEYFLMLVLAARFAAHIGLDFFLKVFYFLGIAVAAYGYWEHFFPRPEVKGVYPAYYRLFERYPFHGDANHIGGLLVLWMGFFIGLLLASEKRREQMILFASIFFAAFPLLWTYSTKSYLSLAATVFPAFLFRPGRTRLLCLLAMAGVTAFLLPPKLWGRLEYVITTLGSNDPFHTSWASIRFMWQNALWNFHELFLTGSGLGSRHRVFYESQYVLVMAETGIIGSFFFIRLLGSVARRMFSALRESRNARERGIFLGWLLGFTALAVHALTCVSFTVVKVALPFWFLTGAILGGLHLGAAQSSLWEKWLLLRAFACVAMVTLKCRLNPGSVLRKQMASAPQPTGAHFENGVLFNSILRAVKTACRYIAGADTCLIRAVAAREMLRREGLFSELKIGVARNTAGKVEAHAWLMKDEKILAGGSSDLDALAVLYWEKPCHA